MSNHPNGNKTPSNFPLEEENDEIDLGDLLATLTDNKWPIIFLALFAVMVGIAKILLDTPTYQVDALLQLEEYRQSLSALEPIAELLESKKPTLAEMEIIRSRMILGAAVSNLKLQIVAKPLYFPVIGAAIARRYQQGAAGVSSPLVELDQYAWGGEAVQVDTLTAPSGWLGKELTLVAGEGGRFKVMQPETLFMEQEQLLLEGEVGRLATRKLKDGQTVSIFVSRLKARPNTRFIVIRYSLADAINQLRERLSVAEKGKNTGILAFTLESTVPFEAVRVLNEITNIYVRRNVEQKSAEAQQTLEFLDRQLPLIKDQLEAASVALNDFRTSQGSIDLDTETQNILSEVVEIRTQITLLQQKRDEFRQRFTASHPSVIAINKQIGRLEAQSTAYDQKIANLPETQQVILRLSRDVKVNSELYTALLNNSQTLRVAQAGTVGDVRIIDAAVLPNRPIKPKQKMILALSLIIGLTAGIALAFIRKALHRGVEDPDLIEKHLNIPVYATIPHSVYQEQLSIQQGKNKANPSNRLAVLALENKDDPAVESLRSLRTTLHFAFLEAHNNLIMITGPSPGVGKSFVSMNLAIVLADAGKKILLIDGDLRKGQVHNTLGVAREKGLSDLISGSITRSEAIRTFPDTAIEFIPTGALPPNPSELLLHERFVGIISEIAKDYDHVIIDSSPILAVTDSSIIGRTASATLMVVRAGEHPMRELEQSAKRLIRAGVPLKGVVFNDIPEKLSRYGYGYGYGYGKYVYRYSYKKSD